MPFKHDVVVCKSTEAVCEAAYSMIIAETEANLEAKHITSFALSGGGTPRGLYKMLANRLDLFKEKKAMKFIMGDDRLVPLDHADSNFNMATECLLKHLPKECIIEVEPTPAVPTTGSPENGEGGARIVAEDYQKRVLSELPTRTVKNERGEEVQIPIVDIVLLGFGSDGHTASVFPDSIASREDKNSFSVSYPSPTMVPKVWRVTMTPIAIQHAKHVIVLACSKDKSWVVRGVRDDTPQGEVPVARFLRNCEGKVTFILDEGAATTTE